MSTLSLLLKQQLNKRQRQAVLAATNKPVAVFAAVGTGKTKTLAYRIAYLIDSRSVDPRQILVLTFGRKAIREAKERLEGIIDSQTSRITIRTFHALANKMLEDNGQTFTIISISDEQDMIKRIMVSQGMDTGGRNPADMRDRIERYKNRGLLPDQLKIDTEDMDKLVKVYTAFQSELKTMHLVTCSDLILDAIALLKNHEDVRAEYNERYRHILVDEFQDVNPAQYELLTLLAGKRTCLWVVGDDDQSIYGWRSADVDIMKRFMKDNPGAEPPIALERNYRSTGFITISALGLIQHNKNRQPKEMYTSNPLGHKIGIHRLADEDEEAEYIAKNIIRLVKQRKISAGRVAVLVRIKEHYAKIAKLLADEGISCHLSGDKHITEKKGAVHTAMAYLRVLTNLRDGQSLRTIINNPRRGIGGETIKKIENYARQHKTSLWEGADQLTGAGKLNKDCRDFVKKFKGWRKMIKGLPAHPAAHHILHASGYLQSLKEEADKADVEKLLTTMKGYSSISEFLKSVVQDAYDEDIADDAVNLLTIYAAKGLEFHTVFLPAWEDGVFPDYRTLEEGKDKELEEQRRLAYVGITRAEKRVYITHIVKRRRNYSDVIDEVKPSRFITEISGFTKIRTKSKQAAHALLSAGADERKSKIIRVNGVVSHNGNYGFGRVINIKGDIVTVQFNDMQEIKRLHKRELKKA